MLAGFISLGLVAFFSQPYLTSKFAKRNGRDPKKWFLIGCALPVIATFILFFLPDLTEAKA
jgi:MFS family permease